MTPSWRRVTGKPWSGATATRTPSPMIFVPVTHRAVRLTRGPRTAARERALRSGEMRCRSRLPR
jgi:hypothetical protein